VAGAAAPTGGGTGATGDIAMTDKPSADETAARAASTVEITDDTNISKSQSRSIVRQLEFSAAESRPACSLSLLTAR
jgi:hypothetical protein